MNTSPKHSRLNMKYLAGILLTVLLLCAALTALADVPLDYDHFKDCVYMFREFDTDYDDVLSDEEIAAVTEFSYHAYNDPQFSLTTITGLGYFTALESISINSKTLTELDLSQNTAVTRLELSNNTLLANLKLGSMPGLLTLNLIGCPELKEVDLSGCDQFLYWFSNGMANNYNGDSHLYLMHNGISFMWYERSTHITLGLGYPDIDIDAAHFPDPQMRKCVADYADLNKNGRLDEHENGCFHQIIDFGNDVFDDGTFYYPGLTSLQGLNYLPMLNELEVRNAHVSALNLSSNAKLKKLRVYNTDMTEIDIGGCPSLLNLVRTHAPKKNGLTVSFDTGEADGIYECQLETRRKMIIRNGSEILYNGPEDPGEITLDGLHYRLADDSDKATLLDAEDRTITELKLPSSIQALGKTYIVNSITVGACSGITPLKSVWLPKSVTSILDLAFYGCTSLKDVYYEGTAADAAKIIIFCDVIRNADWHYESWTSPGEEDNPDNPENPENPDTPDETPVTGGVRLSLDKDKKTAAVIGPEDKNVKAVKIPAVYKDQSGIAYKVTEIKAGAFKNCKKLTKADIGKNVRTIGNNAFNSCTRLAAVSGAANVETIGDGAFQKCAALEKFTIGKKVSKIGKNAFNACKKLKSIIVKTAKLKKGAIGKNAFKGIFKKAVFKCPKKQLKLYKELFLKAGAPKTSSFTK